VRKTKRDINVICDKSGYARVITVDHSGLTAATAADILLPGVGWAVDSASGADNKYDTPVNLTFTQATIPAGPAIGNLAAGPASPAAQATMSPSAAQSTSPLSTLSSTIAPPAQAYAASWQNGPLYYYAGPATSAATAQAGYLQFVPPGYAVVAVAPPQAPTPLAAPTKGVPASTPISAPLPMPPGWLLPAPPANVTASPIAAPPEPIQPASPATFSTGAATAPGPEMRLVRAYPPGSPASPDAPAANAATR
jgi:hypothetical protein